MTSRLGIATLAFLLAAPVVAADRALVIGINDYPGLGIDGPLQSAESDAQKFSAFLQDTWGFDPSEITLLLGEQADSNAIMTNLIDRLVGETTPGDRAVLYYAGLGSRIPDRTGKELDGMTEVLLAHDGASLLGRIPEDAIADILDIIGDRSVTVVIDASADGDMAYRLAVPGGLTTRGVGLQVTDQSGAAERNAAEANSASFAEAPFATGAAERTIWTATAPGQFAWEDADGGVFTTGFIDAIANGTADTNDNGITTNAEVLSALRTSSEAWCNATPDCVFADLGLTPNFAGPVQATAATSKKPAEVAVVQPFTLPETAQVNARPATYDETLGFVTDLFTPSNSANLTLGIGGSNTLKIGDPISFSAQADQTGTLVLLDINPLGELAQIFPSALAADGATSITAGQSLTIPNGLSTNGLPLQIRVSEPAGEGFLLGLFIQDDLPTLQALLPENLSGGPIPNAGQYLYEIAQDLLRLQANSTGSVAVEWSAAYLPYEIIR